MPNPPLPGFPALNETRFTRESLLEGLSQPHTLPETEISVATLYAADIEADIIALVERARRETLDESEEWLLFRGIHILGGRRLTAAYRPFIALLSEAGNDRLDQLLGDAITMSLGRILAGLFDGDSEPLQSVITDQSVDEFVRDAAMGAFALLTFEGHIDRDHAKEFLTHFERDDRSPAGSMIWHGWMTAVGVLGFEHLSPRVLAAFRDRRIPRDVANEADYREILTAALSAPNDPDRLERERLGYINDVLETLERFQYQKEEERDYEEQEKYLEDDSPTDSFVDIAPNRNPFRNVGRNDPCPCGSGKKFKKCCGADPA
jgi:hypothetical protein